MTAVVTPDREELLAWADECQAIINDGSLTPDELRKANTVVGLLRLGAKPADEGVDKFAALTNEVWHELVEKTDRTSPKEYPEMALITFEELREFIGRALSPTGEPKR